MKLSQPMSDAADAMRGDALRAHWLESLIAAALAGGPVREAATERPEAPRVRVEAEAMTQDEYEHQMAAAKRRESRKADSEPRKRAPKPRAAAAAEPSPVDAVRALAEASGVPLVPASQLSRPPRPDRCTHPGTRVIGGWCKECQRMVGPGGY